MGTSLHFLTHNRTNNTIEELFSVLLLYQPHRIVQADRRVFHSLIIEKLFDSKPTICEHFTLFWKYRIATFILTSLSLV